MIYITHLNTCASKKLWPRFLQKSLNFSLLQFPEHYINISTPTHKGVILRRDNDLAFVRVEHTTPFVLNWSHHFQSFAPPRILSELAFEMVASPLLHSPVFSTLHRTVEYQGKWTSAFVLTELAVWEVGFVEGWLPSWNRQGASTLGVVMCGLNFMALSCGWRRPSIHHFTTSFAVGKSYGHSVQENSSGSQKRGRIFYGVVVFRFVHSTLPIISTKSRTRLVFFFDTPRGLVSVVIRLISEPASGCYCVGPRGTCATTTTSGGHAALGSGHKCFLFEWMKIQRMPKQVRVFFIFFYSIGDYMYFLFRPVAITPSHFSHTSSTSPFFKPGRYFPQEFLQIFFVCFQFGKMHSQDFQACISSIVHQNSSC